MGLVQLCLASHRIQSNFLVIKSMASVAELIVKFNQDFFSSSNYKIGKKNAGEEEKACVGWREPQIQNGISKEV